MTSTPTLTGGEMIMSDHTPGPWAWDAGAIPPDGPGRYADIYVLDEDREPIILAEFNDSLAEGRANARLIAAAPCLLKALKQARQDLIGCGFVPPSEKGSGDPEINRIDAVIARTQGS